MEKLKKYLLLILGSVLYPLGVSLFYVPNKIVTGGLSGISNIIYHTFHIPTGISFFVINLLLIIIGIRVLGKTAIIDALISFTVGSVAIELFAMIPPATSDPLIATIFGAVFYGMGLGICFAIGANTGGTDIIARIVQSKSPNLPIGKILLGVDGIIILVGLILFKNVDLCLCGILALFIVTYVIDVVIKKLNVSKLAFVVTDNGREVAEKLVSTSPRGVTIYDATGAYTMTEKQVLMCALKSAETKKFQDTILSIDPEAFVIFSEAQQIVGNGFKVYR